MVERLSGICKTIGSIANTPQKKGEKRRKPPDPRSWEAHLEGPAVKFDDLSSTPRRKPAGKLSPDFYLYRSHKL